MGGGDDGSILIWSACGDGQARGVAMYARNKRKKMDTAAREKKEKRVKREKKATFVCLDQIGNVLCSVTLVSQSARTI